MTLAAARILILSADMVAIRAAHAKLSDKSGAALIRNLMLPRSLGQHTASIQEKKMLPNGCKKSQMAAVQIMSL
jgi:hypothetical protein